LVARFQVVFGGIATLPITWKKCLDKTLKEWKTPNHLLERMAGILNLKGLIVALKSRIPDSARCFGVREEPCRLKGLGDTIFKTIFSVLLNFLFLLRGSVFLRLLNKMVAI